MSRWLNRVITFACTMAIVALLSALVRSNAAPTIAPRADSAIAQPNSQPDRLAQLYMPNRIQTRYRTNDLWQLVYQAMPELPLENQYTNSETGEIDDDYTLMRRLIRYHVYIQNRPPIFRLDWKLTLADYLTVTDFNTGLPVSANERINPETYPGNDVLVGSLVDAGNGNPPKPLRPLDGDRAAIASLTREQRDRLADVLTTVFNPTYPDAVTAHATAEAGQDENADNPAANTDSGRDLPRAPQAGDANLLIPGGAR
jgi:hypothetical protein